VTPARDVVVRESGPDDVHLAPAASALIDSVADEHDIARRAPDWLASKIAKRRAALALEGEEPAELIGFGYWSEWEGGRFVSHSGLVVRPDRTGLGLGRRLKQVLFESTRRQLPRAAIMSLTTSAQVKKMNLSLGFEVVPLDRLTRDEAFWAGCQSCRNYAEVRARGERCCCEAMLLEPEPADGSESEASRG
jgi:GNAT superfamily N-acetyltransferase